VRCGTAEEWAAGKLQAQWRQRFTYGGKTRLTARDVGFQRHALQESLFAALTKVRLVFGAGPVVNIEHVEAEGVSDGVHEETRVEQPHHCVLRRAREQRRSVRVGALEIINNIPTVDDHCIVLCKNGNRFVAAREDLGDVCKSDRHGFVWKSLVSQDV